MRCKFKMNDISGGGMVKFLMQSQLFSGVGEAGLVNFSKIAKFREVKTGEIVFSEGEKAEGFYIVAEGVVKIYKLSAAGKSQIIHIFGPGNPFGEAAIFMENRFPAYAEVVSPGMIIYIKFDEFLRYLKKDPQFALNTIAALCMRLKSFLKTIEELSLDEVSTRLAKYLLETAQGAGSAVSGDRAVFTLDIKKNILAGKLGTIPETLSRTFAKMKKQGLVKMDKKNITVLSLEKLREISA
ncbi:MAG TPA: transcriptional regulator [Candidatus Wallbacteria bacterium]|nr:transcriptional regulator [Candidatus Wallbacteria bacterium]